MSNFLRTNKVGSLKRTILQTSQVTDMVSEDEGAQQGDIFHFLLELKSFDRFEILFKNSSS